MGLIAAACGGTSTDTVDNAVDAPETTVTASSAPETTTSPPETTTTTTAAPEPTVTIAFDGLAPLGDGGDYELWLVGDDGTPVSGGVFDTNGGPVELPLPDGIPGTVEVKVSVETDNDPAPSDSIVLSGAIDAAAGERTTDLAVDIADFSSASGQYILATPTDGDGPPENERSGVWWTVIPRAQSLFLPELAGGWEYELWQVIDGQAVTGGKFSDPFAPDQAAPFSGPEPAPPLVGEDYLLNAPEGLTFPRDLRGTEVVITVEPVPDPSVEPSGIVPLAGLVPDDAIDHTAYAVENVSDTRFPSATLTINEG